VHSRRALERAGASPSSVTRGASNGQLRRVGRGLFVAGEVTDIEVAARFGCVSHATAAQLLGLDLLRPPGLHITAKHRRRALPTGVTLHRSDLGAGDVLELSGILVTSPTRTVLDCARTLDVANALVLIDSALRQSMLTRDALGAAAADLRGHGCVRARRVAGLCDARSESALETLARLLLHSHGLRPELQVDLFDGSFVARVDMLFRDEGLVVELDGFAHHATATAFQRDRRRHNALACLGLRVVRFSWDDVTRRPDYVVATVQRLLGIAA
jgi:very-short-patch-repair endonuclease